MTCNIGVINDLKVIIFTYSFPLWKSVLPRAVPCLSNLDYKKYKLFDVTKFVLGLSTFRRIQQSVSRTWWGMKSLHSVLKLLSSGTTCYKLWAKYKTHMIKEQLLRKVRYNKMNQSHVLSYDETLFLSFRKVPKVKIVIYHSKVTLTGSLLIIRDYLPLNQNKQPLPLGR